MQSEYPVPRNERKIRFFAAIVFNSESRPCSLRDAGRSKGRFSRICEGTAASIRESRLEKPHVLSISAISLELGPICRCTNRSDQAKAFAFDDSSAAALAGSAFGAF